MQNLLNADSFRLYVNRFVFKRRDRHYRAHLSDLQRPIHSVLLKWVQPHSLSFENKGWELKAVHLWHADVRQNQLGGPGAALLLELLLISLKRIFAVWVTYWFYIMELSKHRAQRKQVEQFVVHQDYLHFTEVSALVLNKLLI
jgi:hypothetical protein